MCVSSRLLRSLQETCVHVFGFILLYFFCVSKWVRKSMSVCVCVWVRESVCVCVCV